MVKHPCEIFKINRSRRTQEILSASDLSDHKLLVQEKFFLINDLDGTLNDDSHRIDLGINSAAEVDRFFGIDRSKISKWRARIRGLPLNETSGHPFAISNKQCDLLHQKVMNLRTMGQAPSASGLSELFHQHRQSRFVDSGGSDHHIPSIKELCSRTEVVYKKRLCLKSSTTVDNCSKYFSVRSDYKYLLRNLVWCTFACHQQVQF